MAAENFGGLAATSGAFMEAHEQASVEVVTARCQQTASVQSACI